MAVLGNNTAGGDTFPSTNDRALVSRYQASENGIITEVVMRFDATSASGASMKGLVYADSAGSVGARLGVGAATAVPAGGGLVTSGSLSVSIVSGTWYWLGVVLSDFQPVLSIETTGTSQRKESLTYASPADPYGTPDGSSTELCVYANYTPAYVPPTIPFRGHWGRPRTRYGI